MVRRSPEPSAASAERETSSDSRIGAAWKELRRGAAMSVLRDHLFGSGDNALEPGQVDTLELLIARDAWRMSELAEALRVDPSTATRAVQRLVKAGIAERTACSDDLRRATLTAMLATFTTNEREQFAEYLDRFVAALDDYVRQLDHGN